MMMMGSILLAAEELTTDDRIKAIHERIMDHSNTLYDLVFFLPILIAVICFMLWQRQKKMAENQVKLARMMDELSDKLDKK
jgi:cbb3-type cytochrome oxidase subunit 3